MPAIGNALSEDDALQNQPKKYEVRENPDWRTLADRIEAELVNRNERFTPLPW
jgi:hypothetical protein